MVERLIVVGGGAAGMSAASRVRRLNLETEIMVFEKSGYVSHAPCGIPYYIEGLVGDHKELVYYTPRFFREKRNIDVHVYSEVLEVNLMDKKVKVLQGGAEKTYSWDKLVFATGAEPLKPGIEGVNLKGVHTVHLLEDGVKLKKALEKASRVVVIGGGYIGVEIAEALRAAQKKVTLIEIMPHLLPTTFDQDTAQLLSQELTSNGVVVHLEERVLELKGEGTVKKL